MKTMHLWVPDDQDHWGKPRLIAVGSEPPQPGAVYEIQAKDAKDARHLRALLESPQPAEAADPDGWHAWRKASKRVRLLADYSRELVDVEQTVVVKTATVKVKLPSPKLTKKEAPRA